MIVVVVGGLVRNLLIFPLPNRRADPNGVESA